MNNVSLMEIDCSIRRLLIEHPIEEIKPNIRPIRGLLRDWRYRLI
jgi:hypothetical protein